MLSPESTTYYATWLSKARFSQIKQFPDKNKLYLHTVAFIQYQYYARQDVLIDILLKSVQAIHNQAIKQLVTDEQAKRKGRLALIEQLTSEQEKLERLVSEISNIVNTDVMADGDKIRQIKQLLQQQKEIANSSEQKLSPTQQIRQWLQEDAYYDVLEKLSTQLQNRVSDIVKQVEFNEETSDAVIIAAIQYYKTADGSLGKDVPTDFLDNKQLKMIYDVKGQLRVSLYKALLFLAMASKIKSGHLNLKYSYRYKAIQDYLIDKTTWDNSRETLLRTAGLADFAEVEAVLSHLKITLDDKYHQVNQRINQGENPHIRFEPSKDFVLDTPKVEKKNTEAISDLLIESGFVPIIQVLREIDHICGYTDAFKHYSIKHHKLKPDLETIIAGIMSQGHNLGINKISSISVGINSNTLRQVVTWFFTLKNLQSANNKIIALIDKLALSNLFRYQSSKTHSSSDGQKYQVMVDSLLANYSFKYFGKDKGVSVYTFINDSHSLFYSTVISASEREAAYVVDGLLHNDVIKSSIHSTDMHGFAESVFAATHFIGTSLAPRFKQLARQCIYGFSARQTYEKKGYQILPSRTINSNLIREHWDDILRFMASIKLKESTASQLFKRLSSYAKDHPLYKAIKEFGRIIKTIYILTYIDDVELRQWIEKQLNKVELSNKFAKAVFFDKNREFRVATKEEQEVTVACKVIIQNAIVLWNYLYLSQILVNTGNPQEKMRVLDTIKQGSLISWGHVNMQGEYDFTRASNESMFDMNKILSLKIPTGGNLDVKR